MKTIKKVQYSVLLTAALLTAALTGCASVDSYIEKGDLVKAEQAAGKLKTAPERVDALERVATEYEKMGNAEKKAQIYTVIGDSYISEGYEDKALQMYNIAGNTQKSSPIYTKRADSALKADKPLEAFDLYVKAGMPEADAAVKAGDARFSKRDYGNALFWYEKANNIPKLDTLYIVLGDDSLSSKKYDEAFNLYTKGHADIAVYAKKIAEAAEKNSDIDFAATYYEKAGDKDKALTLYETAADKLLAKKEFDKALSFYEKAGKGEEAKTKVADAKRKFEVQKAVDSLFSIYKGYRSGYVSESDMIKRRNDVILNADINMIDEIFKTAVDQATATASDYNNRAMASYTSGNFNSINMASLERNINEAKFYIAVAQDLIAVKNALIKGLEEATKQ